MLKIFFILFLPLLLFSKIQILTYFPLETHIVKKIGQKEIVPREITNRYLSEFRKIPSSEISRLSNSKIYFHFGLDIEKEYESILIEKNPNLKIIDMSKDVNKINNNPYIWMDPFAMRVIAKNIYEAEKYLGCQREDSSCEFKNNCDGPIKYSAKKTNKKINKKDIKLVD